MQEFGLKYWGQIRVCDYSEVSVDTTTHYLLRQINLMLEIFLRV